ncbi:vesicular integral-membrane protein VIP36-like [Dysidea avara]|uniref:vesicular integral-membrane protein VIP36-like n=1 Tax=Dysidea avara TaxID=196820 RepID=UPI00332E6232
MELSRRGVFTALVLTVILSVSAEVLNLSEELEEDGYFRKEHSLTKPYTGAGMDIPNWDFVGSTMVASSYIRLTPDRQSKQGALWNKIPVHMHNWEILVQFSVSGSGRQLFGDGFAFWYTKEHAELGPVLGNRDFFTGLGVFFDTYSNHNGVHTHEHPYISAIVSDGGVHYDHDKDGTHSQVAGCTAKFRNKEHDTFFAISYVDRELSVFHNIEGDDNWAECFNAPNIDLPTGYYFGFSAATGDLADNHDIISVKVYDVDSEGDENDDGKEEIDWSTITPKAANSEPKRPHVDNSIGVTETRGFRYVTAGIIFLVVVTAIALTIFYIRKAQEEKSKKRFF